MPGAVDTFTTFHQGWTQPSVRDQRLWFHQHCERSPAAWVRVDNPKPLAPKKAAAEDREVQAARQKTPAEQYFVYMDALREVRRAVGRFKEAYTTCHAQGMLSAASALRKPVHRLRVSLRVDYDARAVPPRASQFEGTALLRTDEALAWVHRVDQFLLANQKLSSPPLDGWRYRFQIAPLGPTTLADEARRVREMRQMGLLACCNLRDKLVAQVREELERRDGFGPLRLDSTVRRLRAVLTTLKDAPLPPHWLQYEFAGGFTQDNQHIWRNAVRQWLDVFDCVPPYEPEGEPAPDYTEHAVRQTRRRHWGLF